jgi:hypothetical protein
MSEQFRNPLETRRKRQKICSLHTNTRPSFSWLGIGTSIKRGGVRLVLWSQTSTLSEMIMQVLSTCEYL